MHLETIENSRGRFKPHPKRRVTPRDLRIKEGRNHNWRDDDVFATINWRVYEHRELWDMIQSATPGQLGGMADRWKVVSDGVGSATSAVRKIVERLGQSWRGPSAAEATASVSALANWASGASERAQSVGQGLHIYTTAVERAKHTMPEPVHYYAERWFREGYNVTTLDGPNGLYMLKALLDDHLPTKHEAKEAQEKAILVMKEYEATSRGVHSGLPEPFDAPPPATAVQPEPPQIPPGGDGGREQYPHPLPPAPVPVTTPISGTGVGDTTTAAMATLNPGYPAGQPSGPGPGPGPNSAYGAGPGVGGVAAGGIVGRGPAGGFGIGPGGARGGAGSVGAAGARGGGSGSSAYSPFGGAAADEKDGEHKNRYCKGIDLMDDLPPAFPSVLGE
ncbi:PPE domain-containing protein [Actinocrispum sp. NPDC049592]|uniref:PPE domain-containing protein n=1 Tax=Actinocrispum sp. NPDC049592 TaxID=3154835 RepID=UPI00343DF288